MTTQLSLFNDVPVIAVKSKSAVRVQLDLFGQAETAQFGVRANPLMPLSPGRLGMILEDVRTADQVEADIQAEIRARMSNLL